MSIRIRLLALALFGYVATGTQACEIFPVSDDFACRNPIACYFVACNWPVTDACFYMQTDCPAPNPRDPYWEE